MEAYLRFYMDFIAALVVSGLVVALLEGCGAGAEGDGGEKGSTLTVFAASSLTDAFGVLAKSFEEQNSGTEVRQTFESSSTLLTQIQQGAPADVFASAAEEEMNTAVDDGLWLASPRSSPGTARLSWFPATTPQT